MVALVELIENVTKWRFNFDHVLFGIKSAIAWRNNLIVTPFTIKIFLKTKVKPNVDDATDFHDKEIPKVGSNYICLAVILINFILIKEENGYPEVF